MGGKGGTNRMSRQITTTTALGDCVLDAPGTLLPCHDRHAPIRHYRSYGEWWQAGQKEATGKSDVPAVSRAPCWPFGQDVTRLYPSTNRASACKIDDRLVNGVLTDWFIAGFASASQ